MRASRADIVSYLCRQMGDLYPPQEKLRIARMVAAHKSGATETAFIVEPNLIIEIDDLEQVARELAEARPVQYIIGSCEFCGFDFSIREGALIPRPETEELVMWVKSIANDIVSPQIVDVCTGSGCIAIALAKMLPQATITATDLSEDALAIAKENVERHAVTINLIKDDALQGLKALGDGQVDIIVSNPPYIPLSERDLMHTNVTLHEPAMALFVEDSNPLIFYQAIAQAATRVLKSDGYLLFEIHSPLAQQTVEMLEKQGYEQITLRQDYFGRDRMICCRPKQR